jgi:hypothetical protein
MVLCICFFSSSHSSGRGRRRRAVPVALTATYPSQPQRIFTSPQPAPPTHPSAVENQHYPDGVLREAPPPSYDAAIAYPPPSYSATRRAEQAPAYPLLPNQPFHPPPAQDPSHSQQLEDVTPPQQIQSPRPPGFIQDVPDSTPNEPPAQHLPPAYPDPAYPPPLGEVNSSCPDTELSPPPV